MPLRRSAAAAATLFILCAGPGGRIRAEEVGALRAPPESAPPAAAAQTAEEYGRPLRSAEESGGFGEAAALPAALPDLWHGETEVVLTIPGSDRELTRRYIAQYSSPGGLQWLQAVMRRGEPFLPFIRREVEARGLPQELAYLPVIESAFVSTAVSRSGAVGLWQFMKNSISPFGIRVDDWVDERRDFWKATDGALRKLDENYRHFGDWPLALAAYNAGLGAVGRAARAAGVADYWYLSEKKHLKAETIHYVPKFLAVSEILSNPGRYGLDLGWPEETRWTRVTVGRTVDLALLAAEAKVDLGMLKKGNGELHYGVTPPDPKYQLKVRLEDAPAVEATLARKDLQLVKYYFHTVRSGDTLSALARHYGVSVDHILNANPGLQPRYLKLGARILVPAFKEVGPYERQRSSDAVPVFEGSHLVKRGETLWSIALAYEVDPEVLAEANGLELSSTLREGRLLKTPILKAEDR